VPLELGGFQIGGLHIAAALVCHPGPTVGYRISEDGVAMAYIPDRGPMLGVQHLPSADWISGFDLAVGANLLIHDCRYSSVQYAKHEGTRRGQREQVVERSPLASPSPQPSPVKGVKGEGELQPGVELHVNTTSSTS
jgi:hypothetical protein